MVVSTPDAEIPVPDSVKLKSTEARADPTDAVAIITVASADKTNLNIIVPDSDLTPDSQTWGYFWDQAIVIFGFWDLSGVHSPDDLRQSSRFSSAAFGQAGTGGLRQSQFQRHERARALVSGRACQTTARGRGIS